MQESTLDLQVTSPAAAEDALAYASCAMLPSFTVTYQPSISFPANREDLRAQLDYTLAPYRGTLQLQELMHTLYHKDISDFSTAQLRSFSGQSSMYTFVRKARLDAAVQYYTSAKEANDLICLAAEIGTNLQAKLGNRPTLEKIFRVYQGWINANFRYLSTGRPEDHSAYALMQTGSGVCQAIAALTVLVLPHLGLETQYISGQGLGPDGFGSHAWNVVRVSTPNGHPGLENQLQWYHVDFTFGMNIPTPHTLTPLSTAAFEKTHLWDREHVHQASLQYQYHQTQRLRCAQIHLQTNSPKWHLGEVTVTSPRPILVGSEQQGHWVDLYTILRFLGGGCEYLPQENRLRIVLYDRQFLVENGRAYLDGPAGYLGVDILRHLPLQLTYTEPYLCIRAVTA